MWHHFWWHDDVLVICLKFCVNGFLLKCLNPALCCCFCVSWSFIKFPASCYYFLVFAQFFAWCFFQRNWLLAQSFYTVCRTTLEWMFLKLSSLLVLAVLVYWCHHWHCYLEIRPPNVVADEISLYNSYHCINICHNYGLASYKD